MKYLICFLFITITSFKVYGQELNMNVQLNAPRLQLVDPKVFDALEKDIYELLNNTRWTDDEFENFEKIEGNLNITITEEISNTAFRADFFIQTTRPVYNSNYKTQVLNFVDKDVTFTYREYQPIQNSYNTYIDPLSSLLTYYVYMILAADYDTFEPYGGDPHYQTVQNIINAIPPGVSKGTGWDQQGNRRNRFWMYENNNNPRLRPMRQAIYEFHRSSLDKMHEDADRSRAIMVSALTTIEQVNNAVPNSSP